MPKLRVQVRGMTVEEEFLAREAPGIKTVENHGPDSENLTADTIVTHETRGRVLMWKPGADGKYTCRPVAENSRGILLSQGWKARCPDCETNHEQSEYPPEDPNSCPARPPIPWIACPVCGKRQFDNMRWENIKANPEASDSGAMIVDEQINASTPRDRVVLIRNLHMWTRHPRQSQMMAVSPLPTALKEIVDGMRAG